MNKSDYNASRLKAAHSKAKAEMCRTKEIYIAAAEAFFAARAAYDLLNSAEQIDIEVNYNE
jgi:hypothetical protein